MKRALCLIAAATLTGPALAGEVSLGVSKLMGLLPNTCHEIRFTGPADAVRRYEKRQKDRFEDADPAVIERLGKTVLVSLEVVASDADCAKNSGVPEKIVLVPPKSREPELVIKLAPEGVELGNLAGAKFTATNASATVPVEDIERLSGKQYDLHLIYSDRDRPYKDKWKADYSAKILRAK